MKNETLNVDGFLPVYKGLPPFMKYEGGFGYSGVLLEDIVTGKLQCHLCGHLVNNLSKHLFHKHKEVTPEKYREMTGINRTTPLMSTSTLKKYKNNFLDLTKEKRNAIIARLKENNKSIHARKTYVKRTGTKGTTQMQNKFGTCPEQAKTQFMREYQKLGRIPSNSEMSGRLRNLVYTRFPSYKEALLAWGISDQEYRQHVTEGKVKAYQARADHDFYRKYTDEDVKTLYSDFYFQNKRLPTWSEVKQYGLPSREVFKRVFGTDKSLVEGSFASNEL